MRICLVKTPSHFLMDDKSFPPLGLMAVGTNLAIKGHSVKIHDGPLDKIPDGYDAYGFGPTTPEYSAAMQGKEIIRSMNPGARVVIGGAFVTLNKDRSMKDYWDCVVTGDGELAAEAAFCGTANHVSYPSLPLDTYPIINRSLLNLSEYKFILRGRRSTSVVTSRGCPWRCAFCCKTEYNNTVRMRSAGHVNLEIDYLHNDLGYQAIHIPDDIFILNRARTEAIARHCGELGIIWRCLVRGDLIVKYGKEFVELIGDNGCVNVGMGIESGSNTILKNVNKRETAETIKQAITMLKSAGITVKGYFILGLPGESRETLSETEQFLAEMQLNDVDIKIYQPYPGSPIWQHKDRFDIEWDEIALEHQYYKGRQGDYHGTIRTSALANSEIVQAMNNLERQYKHA